MKHHCLFQKMTKAARRKEFSMKRINIVDIMTIVTVFRLDIQGARFKDAAGAYTCYAVDALRNEGNE